MLEINKIGKAISYLRKRAGYTQKDLADRIGISDKAVSKWERGQGLPEIGYLRKLSILLDTDTDSLLSGNVIPHDNMWYGIVVLEESAYGVNLGTIIYDKPIIYFVLSYFLLVGIRDITIICGEQEKRIVDGLLGTGEGYGVSLTTTTGKLKDVLKQRSWVGNIMMVYGRSFIYGVDQTRFFQKAMVERDHITMLVLPRKKNSMLTHVKINIDSKVISSDSDDFIKTQYDFSEIPILFFPADKLTDISKDSKIEKYISEYTVGHDLYVQVLDRGFVEIELDDWNSVQEASTFLRIVQERCGMNVYCLEEVAWRRGYIGREKLKEHYEKYKGTDYGEYLLRLYNR